MWQDNDARQTNNLIKLYNKEEAIKNGTNNVTSNDGL